MSVNPGLDIRTDAGPPPVLEEEQKTFDQILLEKNIAALFGIGTAYFTYKAHPITRKLVKNHGWIGFLNVLTFGGIIGVGSWLASGRRSQIYSNLPDGYFRKIKVDNMPDTIAAKKKYFDQFPEELRQRERVIGLFRLQTPLPTISQQQQNRGRPYVTYAELRAKAKEADKIIAEQNDKLINK